MEDTFEKKEITAGRPRGTSLLSVLREAHGPADQGDETVAAGPTEAPKLSAGTVSGSPPFMSPATIMRNWCSGQPPKKSYLGGSCSNSIESLLSRHSAPIGEIDALLDATMVDYRGHLFLPMTAENIYLLSPDWKGEHPIADMEIFESILIHHEVNQVHADHVLAALERIGAHCKNLLVKGPISTDELGNVFRREAGNISPGNDWDHILECLPNLKWLLVVHAFSQKKAFSRNTVFSLYNAVNRRQAAQNLTSFGSSSPPRLLTNSAYNAM